MLYAVIMAGGSGTRLWPESRNERAKQFLPLAGEKTMIAETVDRLETLVPPERVFLVAGSSMATRLRESLPQIAEANLLLEPAARNTAPCIGWAAVELLRHDPEAVMVVLPADHVIRPANVFCETLRFAAEVIEENPERLVTLGIKPTFPATSYGYIERGAALESPATIRRRSLTKAHDVLCFHEKPDADRAGTFLASGRFAWNAGIFVWKAKTILELLKRFEPEMGARLDAIAQTPGREAVEEHFPAMKNISIDYAVMEKAEAMVVLEAPFEWDDVGTWCSLERLYADRRDAAGNIAIRTRLLTVGSSNNVVRGQDANRLIALLGVEDLIVVQTPDATLIAKKDCEESIRELIGEMRRRGLAEYL